MARWHRAEMEKGSFRHTNGDAKKKSEKDKGGGGGGAALLMPLSMKT